MRPIVLFRASLAEEGELKVCQDYFPVITQRSQVKKDDLVIPRYSALPWYKEFEEDVKYNGGKLINTYREHCYVSDLQNWYFDLKDFTPKTWFYLEQIPELGPFVLKGQTNSKKHNWRTHMFANTKKEAIKVYSQLTCDGYIGNQEIYIRKYVPLRRFLTGVQGLPITEEYRFFVLDGQIVSGAFYWSEYSEHIRKELKQNIDPSQVPKDFLDKIINIVKPNIRFFVLDVARTETNEWIVIELNDGQQSGLSDNDPKKLYSNIKKILDS